MEEVKLLNKRYPVAGDDAIIEQALQKINKLEQDYKNHKKPTEELLMELDELYKIKLNASKVPSVSKI